MRSFIRIPIPVFCVAMICLALFATAQQDRDEVHETPVYSGPGVQGLDEEAIQTIALHIGETPHSEVAAAGEIRFELYTLPLAVDSRPLLTGTTNSKGDARLRIGVPPKSYSTSKNRQLLCVVRVIEPGYQFRIGHMQQPWGPNGQDWRCRIALHKGASVRVRGLDAQGKPASCFIQARKQSTLISHEDGPIHWSRLGFGTDHVLHFSETVELDFHASQTNIYAAPGGNGMLPAQKLDPSDPPEVLTIPIHGSHRIRCRALAADGKPLEGGSFRVLWIGPENEQRLSEWIESPLDDWRLNSQGLIASTGRTDKNGIYEATGLREGRYRVFFDPLDYYAKTDLAEVVAARSDFDGMHCEVQLASIHLQMTESIPKDSFLESRRLVVGHDDQTTQLSSHVLARFARSDSKRDLDLPVFPNRAYRIRTDDPLLSGFGSSITTLEQEQWEGTTPSAGHSLSASMRKIVLDPSASEAANWVDVHLRLPGGYPLNFTGQIESLTANIPTFEFGPFQPSGKGKLPPGRYRLILEGRPPFRSCGLSPYEVRTLGLDIYEFEIQPGVPFEQEFALELGGRLEIRVDGAALPYDRRFVIQHPEKLGFYSEARAACAEQAQLVLLHPSGIETPLTWLKPKEEEYRTMGPTQLWPLGQTHRTEGVPSGEQILEARMPGGRIVRVPVKVQSGHTQHVTIDLGGE